MSKRFSPRSAALAATAIVFSLGAVAAASAQDVWSPPKQRVYPAEAILQQVKPNGETPRLANGKPDLSGQWGGGIPSPVGPYGTRKLGVFEPDQMVMQRGAAWNKPLYKPEHWQKVRDLDFSKVDVDPVFRCLPQGVPRQGAPNRILQTPKETWLINRAYAGTFVRIVPTDGVDRPEGTDFSYSLGFSNGHWDGDTLVIETVGFNDTTWLSWQGYFHTDQMKVTERLRRDGDLLYYQFTVDDPEVLMQPWTSNTFLLRLNPNPHAWIEPVEECTESDLEHMVDPYERG
jgi:hypothetical protein